jgi:hypothetical protein
MSLVSMALCILVASVATLVLRSGCIFFCNLRYIDFTHLSLVGFWSMVISSGGSSVGFDGGFLGSSVFLLVSSLFVCFSGSFFGSFGVDMFVSFEVHVLFV